MQTPPYLKAGDRIAVAAPARSISRVELQPALGMFQGWGLEVEAGPDLFKVQNQFSGSDETRKRDFQRKLDDPEIKAIFCARGGYGSVRIIDRLDFSKFKQNPKWIVGYSDITVFHSHINENFGIETLHAEMPFKYDKKDVSAESLESLRKALFGEKLEYRAKAHSFNRNGIAKGILTGGNLSMLYSLCGSASDINTKNKILFIEDLDEYLYHIDRMMMNLKRSGKLDQLTGMIVGGMSDMNDNMIPFGKTAEEIIRDEIAEYDFPVCFDFPAGHSRKNLALVMGGEVELEISDRVSLSF
ncbi:MAG: LD-carboxypeptidase [Bacteroidales bacterium]|nr:LD-carboxypeptidase [Bacteroidales bacterium]MCF8401568.1 LD-carboxypeptidase [Bacteroidales bacterium]